MPLRTVSQYEAERLNAPPSYNSLSVLEESSLNVESLNDPNNVTSGEDVCAHPEGSTDPPSYACVMLHHDMFHIGSPDVSKPFLTNENT